MYECVVPTEANFVRDNAAEECNCRRQCHHVRYYPTVSQSLLANSVAQHYKDVYHLKDTIDEIILDHCFVEVGVSVSFICIFYKCSSGCLLPVLHPSASAYILMSVSFYRATHKQCIPLRATFCRVSIKTCSCACQTCSLHFTSVVDDAKCLVVTRVCVSVCVSVCLSAAVRPYYCTNPDVT